MTHLRSWTPLLALALFAAACAHGAGDNAAPARSLPSTATDDTLTIAVGQQASTRDRALRLTFVRLVSESRCPKNVVCVWQGDAAIRVSATSATGTAEATIHTALDPRVLELSGYRIQLLDVLPYPGSDVTGPATIIARVTRALP